MITFQELGRKGQLGNQMFQYALLMAVAERRGYDFGVPYANRSHDRYQHFALPDLFLCLLACNSTNVRPKSHYRERQREWFVYHDDVFDVTDGTDFFGHFQSEKYFAHLRPRVLREFQQKPQTKDRVGVFLARLRSRVEADMVFVHVRRTDALTNPHLNVPTVDYYRRAMAHFPHAHFVVISDDYGWCRAHLPIPPGQMTTSPFRDHGADLELMRRCDGGIMPNSTFSWWGAWLGDENRKIVCFKDWARGCPGDDVIPERWIKES